MRNKPEEVMPLGCLICNVKKYSPHYSKTVKPQPCTVTVVQSTASKL